MHGSHKREINDIKKNINGLTGIAESVSKKQHLFYIFT